MYAQHILAIIIHPSKVIEHHTPCIFLHTLNLLSTMLLQCSMLLTECMSGREDKVTRWFIYPGRLVLLQLIVSVFSFIFLSLFVFVFVFVFVPVFVSVVVS